MSLYDRFISLLSLTAAVVFVPFTAQAMFEGDILTAIFYSTIGFVNTAFYFKMTES
jgi:hypothetical protein